MGARSEKGGELSLALASQLMNSGGQFVLSMLLVRQLGLEAFGVVALVLLVATWGAGLGQALLAQPFSSLAATEGRASSEGRSVIILGCALSIALGAAALAVTSMVGTGAIDAAAPGRGGSATSTTFASGATVVAALVALRTLSPVARCVAFAAKARSRTVGGDAAMAGVAILFVLYFASTDAGLTPWRALLSICLATATANIVWASAATWSSAWYVAGPLRSVATRYWDNGRWLALNQVASWFGSGSFQIAAASQLGLASLGALRAAQTVIGVIGVLLQALELALPRIARRVDSATLGDFVRGWTLGAVALFAALGVVIGVAAPNLARLLATDPAEVLFAEVALEWLAFAPMLAAAAAVLQVGFRAIEQTRSIFLAYVASAVLSAVAAAPVVDRYGLAGATGGLLAGQAIFVLGLGLLWLRRDAGAPRSARIAACAQ